MENFKQSKEWEQLFQSLINKAKSSPASSLFLSNSITAEKVEDAAGNHVFDDHFDYWKISEVEGHQIRSVFQYFSVRSSPEFKKYIQDLIDNSMELEWNKSRSKA